MADKLDKDGNIIPEADPKEGDPEGNKGAGGDNSGGDGGNKGALTKEDIQTIIKDSMAEAIKGEVTSMIDSRISGATKTIYGKVEMKKVEDPDNKKANNDGAGAEATKELKQKKDLITVYAEAEIKGELGKAEPEIQTVIDKILAVEMATIEIDENLTNRDQGQKVAKSVIDSINSTIKKIEEAQVDKLKKAGQVIDIGTGPSKVKPEDDYKAGQKLAEERHKK